jgi:hypothetical protein
MPSKKVAALGLEVEKRIAEIATMNLEQASASLLAILDEVTAG